MTYPSAVKIALAAIAREQRVYAFDASLARRGFGGDAAMRALKRWKRLEQAKESLKQGRLL